MQEPEIKLIALEVMLCSNLIVKITFFKRGENKNLIEYVGELGRFVNIFYEV